MDFQKAGILLEKIHALFKNMSADSDSVSEIEKDLMRAYLRQFYEHFLPHGESPADAATPIELPPIISRKPPVKKSEPLIEPEEEEEDDDENEEEEQQAFVPPPPPPPKKKEKDKKVEAPAPKMEKPEPKKPLVAPDAEEEEEEEEEEGEELENLFEHHQARELSEKLSELPIQDLGKAMGLNEKIFTINELFGGDQELFKQTIQAMNGMASFEEAKNFLVREVAIRNNWAHHDKKNKAKNFIKLVRRRFIG